MFNEDTVMAKPREATITHLSTIDFKKSNQHSTHILYDQPYYSSVRRLNAGTIHLIEYWADLFT